MLESLQTKLYHKKLLVSNLLHYALQPLFFGTLFPLQQMEYLGWYNLFSQQIGTHLFSPLPRDLASNLFFSQHFCTYRIAFL